MKNRELKFRAWNGVEWLGVDEFTLWDLEHPHKGQTFQQFTGMLDKNGKEVYEGDIIQWFRMLEATIEYPAHRAKYTSIVEYEDGRFGFVMRGFNDMFQTLCDEYEIEVVGNIKEGFSPTNPNVAKYWDDLDSNANRNEYS